MPILTTKELQALSDQLDFEKVLHCKYLSVLRRCSTASICPPSRSARTTG